MGDEGTVVTTKVPSAVADGMHRNVSVDGIGHGRYANDLDLLNLTMTGMRTVR
jgi:hypothetical protein